MRFLFLEKGDNISAALGAPPITIIFASCYPHHLLQTFLSAFLVLRCLITAEK